MSQHAMKVPAAEHERRQLLDELAADQEPALGSTV